MVRQFLQWLFPVTRRCRQCGRIGPLTDFERYLPGVWLCYGDTRHECWLEHFEDSVW
jgi:hypothetical protein